MNDLVEAALHAQVRVAFDAGHCLGFAFGVGLVGGPEAEAIKAGNLSVPLRPKPTAHGPTGSDDSLLAAPRPTHGSLRGTRRR